MRELFFVVSILALLAGCQSSKTYYDRQGATPAMFEKDSKECKSLARQTGTVKPGAAFGYSNSEIGIGHAGADGSFTDRSDDQYYRQYEECLRQKGWKKVSRPAQQ